MKKSLSNLGEDIGLLFQLADDFLDKKVLKNWPVNQLKKITKKVNQL